MTEWQPISTAPRDGTEVLVFGYGDYAVAWNYDDGNGWQDMGDIGWAGFERDVEPTHWLPLPPPPGDAT